jgi:hypothetical protein
MRGRPELRARFVKIKAAFLIMPFPEKVALFAEHANDCLRQAQLLIAEASAGPETQPSAARVWESMLGHRAAHREKRMAGPELIAHLFPQLSGKKQEIALTIKSAYAFWGNFSGCNEYGAVLRPLAKGSFLRHLSDGEIAQIDAATGMRALGKNMRGYANHLYQFKP